MIILNLFCTFVTIGIFSFGGGYAMISFIQKEVVLKHGWISLQEFTDMIAISQATPGPIAVNTATYTGFKVGGMGGAIAANVGLVLPAFFIIITLYVILQKNKGNTLLNNGIKGLKPMTVALILGSGFLLIGENITSFYDGLLCLAALFLTTCLKVNPVLVILGFGILGIIFG